jgi:hypothetical protein
MSGDENGELLAALTATLAFVEQMMEQRAVLLNTVERGALPPAEHLAELRGDLRRTSATSTASCDSRPTTGAQLSALTAEPI